jgi:hypothetical protein
VPCRQTPTFIGPHAVPRGTARKVKDFKASVNLAMSRIEIESDRSIREYGGAVHKIGRCSGAGCGAAAKIRKI